MFKLEKWLTNKPSSKVWKSTWLTIKTLRLLNRSFLTFSVEKYTLWFNHTKLNWCQNKKKSVGFGISIVKTNVWFMTHSVRPFLRPSIYSIRKWFENVSSFFFFFCFIAFPCNSTVLFPHKTKLTNWVNWITIFCLFQDKLFKFSQLSSTIISFWR